MWDPWESTGNGMLLRRKPRGQVPGPGTTYPPGASRSGGTPSRGVFASGASQQTSIIIAGSSHSRQQLQANHFGMSVVRFSDVDVRTPGGRRTIVLI